MANKIKHCPGCGCMSLKKIRLDVYKCENEFQGCGDFWLIHELKGAY